MEVGQTRTLKQKVQPSRRKSFEVPTSSRKLDSKNVAFRTAVRNPTASAKTFTAASPITSARNLLGAADGESTEAAEEEPGIWQPNQKDQEARNSTFAHPSQTTLAQATKQLRSQWAPLSFHDMNLYAGLSEAIEKETLGHLGKEVKPTDIQALAIPIITKLDKSGFDGSAAGIPFKSFLIAAETGSGKTLAYLVPLVNRLKREEQWAKQHPDSPESIFSTRRAASPRSLVIVPTSELAEQIYGILKKVSHEVKLTISALLPKFDDHTVRKSILPKYIDVLISTPHRLNEFMQSGELRSGQVRYMIIDEADTIFDRSFTESMTPLLNTVRNQLSHLVLCTATIPLALEEKLSQRFPGMQRIVAPKIHTAPRRIDFQLILESDKREALLDLLQTIQAENKEPDRDIRRAIVFCNSREGVREVYEFIKASADLKSTESPFELVPFTRDNFDRHTALERFNSAARTANTKKLRILLTTDMASRGLDTIQAKTVILYDVPYSSIDLLHRLGRTARAGTRGRAYMVVSKAEYRGRTKEWVNEIRDRLIRGVPLV
jgi:ATP-dependent RNA helicase MRH4, mitochondrial